MKKCAIIVFCLGLFALAGAVILRWPALTTTPSQIGMPPGEGKAAQSVGIYTKIFHSWALSGSTLFNAAQKEALLQLSSATGSKLATWDLKRRFLEKKIALAQNKLKKIQLEHRQKIEAAKQAAAAKEQAEILKQQEQQNNKNEAEPDTPSNKDQQSDTTSQLPEDGLATPALEPTAVSDTTEPTTDTESPTPSVANSPPDKAEIADASHTASPAATPSEAPPSAEPLPETSPEELAAQEALAKLKKEYQETLAKLNEKFYESEKSLLAKIVVLRSGASRGIESLLTEFGQPFRTISLADINQLNNKNLLLVLPSGSIERNLAPWLEKFVESGGKLVCFTQPRGRELSLLPGNPSGYGWLETDSAYSKAVTALKFHPTVASLKKYQFSAAVDGFFLPEKLPADTEIILKDTKNGCPVAISYPFGKGHIVATTLYTDWKATSNSLAREEASFWRNLFAWLTSSNEGLLDAKAYEPGTKIKVSLQFSNQSTEMAQKVMVSYLSTKTNKPLYPIYLKTKVLPEENIIKNITLRAPKVPGIYPVAYALLRKDGSFLKYWEKAKYVISAKEATLTDSSPGFGAAVTTTDEVISSKKRYLTFKLHLWNYRSTPITLGYQGPDKSLDINLSPSEYRQLPIRIMINEKTPALSYYDFNIYSSEKTINLSKLVTIQNEPTKEAQK